MGGKGSSYSPPSLNPAQITNALSQVDVKPSPYEQQLSRMAGEMWSSTSPLRGYFLEDFQNFLRPPGYTSPGGTQATGQPGTTTTGGIAAPSYNDIYANLSNIFSPDSNKNYNTVSQATDYFKNIGVDLFQDMNFMNTYGENVFGQSPNSQSTLDALIKNKAQSIFNEQVAKGMQQISQGAGGTSQQQGQNVPAGFTNQNLYNPYNLPGYAPLYQLARTGIESQYNPARENIMASVPRGGALYQNLANLEMSRAAQAGELPATIAAPLIGDIMNKAYGVAFQTPQTAIAGLSAANQGLSNRTSGAYGLMGSMYGTNSAAAMQQAAMNQQSGLAGAAGMGSLLGMGMKGLGK